MDSVTQIGRYKVKHKLGEGGMGEVYLAEDSELGREVAIKVLLPEFFSDEERVNRFKLEAKSVSALNHPNIITIYEIVSNDETNYIVTEFIKGETLRSLINRKAITKDLAIQFSHQIASALNSAHAAGIIHRDIKPENIMVREDGIVKVLDFGLAKPTQVGSEDKTLGLVATKAGMVMGSVGYMSPEQARGIEVDPRTDIWSLGVVLYEMLTGKAPFDGETMTDILANIIHKEPLPLSKAVDDVPLELQKIIDKTLAKNREQRYRSAKELLTDLRGLNHEFSFSGGIEFVSGQHQIGASPTTNIKRHNTEDAKTLIHHTASAEFSGSKKESIETSTNLPQPAKRRNWWMPLVIVVLGVLIAAGAWFYSPSSSINNGVNLDSLDISSVDGGDKAFNPSISPDGKYLGYTNYENGKRSLMVKQIATGSTIVLVEPLEGVNFLQPTFSADGNYVYYVEASKGVGTLYQIPSLGGTPKKLVVDVDSKVALAPDGSRMAFRRRDAESGLESVIIANIDGTNEQNFVSSKDLEMKSIYEVAWSPDNRDLLIAGMRDFVSDELVRSRLLLVSLKDKEVRKFGEKEWFNATSFNWAKDNLSVLMVAKADDQEPAQIWQVTYPSGVPIKRITNDTSGYVQMSFARDAGVITGSKNSVISSLWAFSLQSKELTQLTSETKNLIGAGNISFMPDGKLLLSKVEGMKANILTLDADGKNEKTLTNEEGFNGQAVISSDGKYIVYTTTRTKNYSIWRIDADGKNPLQLTSPEGSFDSKPQITVDGKMVFFERRSTDLSKSTIMKISIEGGEPQEVLNDESPMKMFPKISADGKLFAYSTMTFNRVETKFDRTVKVFTLNNESIGELKKQLETSLGYVYNFSPDNKNLTYISHEGVPNIYNISLENSTKTPITNFTSGHILNFGWAKDGKKLYIVRGIMNNELVLLKSNQKV